MPSSYIDFDPTNEAELPPSPCINVCEMDSVTALCKGCLRDIDEIISWSFASDIEKRQTWQRIRQRRKASVNG